MALHFLQDDNFDCAVQCLLAALSECYSVSSHSEKKSGHRHDDRVGESESGHQQLQQLPSLQWEMIGKNQAVHRNPQHAAGHSLYANGVTFSDDRDDEANELDEASWNVIEAALLYNLALFYQCQAMYNDHGGSSTLLQALRLYQNIILVVMPSNDQRGELDQMTLAVFNNMGCINLQLRQFGLARECFRDLRKQIAKRVGSVSRLQRIKDYGTFILSAMLSHQLPDISFFITRT